MESQQQQQHRVWNRGSSKNARGNSNSRPLNPPSDYDSMMSTIQKSQIASIVQGARATVQQQQYNEGSSGTGLTRPFTPGDMPRHLFSGDDYGSNRPGSSYKMKSVVGQQAIEEFSNAISGLPTSAGGMSITTTASSVEGKMKIGGARRSGSQNRDTNNIINVLQKAEQVKKTRAGQLPALEPISSKTGVKPVIAMSSIKTFDNKGPVKPPTHGSSNFMQSQSFKEDMNTSGIGSSDLGVEGKPIKKVTLKKEAKKSAAEAKEEQKRSEDYSDLMNNDNRIENLMKFDMQRMENLQRLQETQMQIKTANKKREDQDGENEDDYEDYFEKQMEKDMQGIESYESQIDYFGALKNIEEKVKLIDQSQAIDASENQDGLDEEYLLKNIEGESDDKMTGYMAEYFDVITEMGRICSLITHNNKIKGEGKVKIEEDELLELCPRIWTLATEHEKQSPEVRAQCFLETLLKGSFSLLAIKYPKSVLRLSACNMHLFMKIFEQMKNNEPSQDFKKLFSYLFETMRGILIYAKEGTFDLLFKQENLIPHLSRVIQVCFLDRSHDIVKLTSHVVNKKEILNEDLVYDLMNYTIGSIKCFTQSNVDVQKEAVKNRYIMVLSKCISKALIFGKNEIKKSQMLVQICGALRNLANDEESYKQICSNRIIQQLLTVLDQFKGHKELMLNISRILSKTSMDQDCSLQIILTEKLNFLVDQMEDYQNFTPFVIRIAFVLANLTTYFEEAREQIGMSQNGLKKVLSLTLLYYQKEEANLSDDKKSELIKGGGKEQSGNLGNFEECLVKLVRLVANLSTEERFFIDSLPDLKQLISDFMDKTIGAIQRKNVQNSEEFILNGISCATNLLFYDTPHSQIFQSEQRLHIFQALKSYILQTSNEEIQIETVRVLSNLSRHSVLCEEFVTDKNFVEAIIIVLDHTLRDLVFYTIGIIINISLHQISRPKILDKGVISKLIDVLKDSNIEDMDLSKVAAKAIHNMTSESNYWNRELIQRLDEVLMNLGEELDSIMDVASEDELEEIKGLRDLVNALINDMPEPMFDCPIDACGRKFKNKEELEKHIERRHISGAKKQ